MNTRHPHRLSACWDVRCRLVPAWFWRCYAVIPGGAEVWSTFLSSQPMLCLLWTTLPIGSVRAEDLSVDLPFASRMRWSWMGSERHCYSSFSKTLSRTLEKTLKEKRQVVNYDYYLLVCDDGGTNDPCLRVMQGARFEARQHQPLEIVNVRDKNASQIGSLLAPGPAFCLHHTTRPPASRKHFPGT